MSFGPLGAVPLAATLPVWTTGAVGQTFLTFSGSARGALRIRRSASATLRFTNRATAAAPSPGIEFVALTDSFVFRAEPDDYDFAALPQSFILRGIRE